MLKRPLDLEIISDVADFGDGFDAVEAYQLMMSSWRVQFIELILANLCHRRFCDAVLKEVLHADMWKEREFCCMQRFGFWLCFF